MVEVAGRTAVAHLGLLYPAVSLSERVIAAAEDGFSHVDFWEVPPGELDRVADSVASAGVQVNSINVPRGSHAECGRMADPEQVAQWRRSFEETLSAAVCLGVQFINMVAGNRQPGVDQDAVLTENLNWALSRTPVDGAQLLIEPLSETTYPGYLITSCEQVIRLRAGLDEPGRLGLLFDTFHVAAEGHNVSTVFAEYAPWVRHVQVADSPGRGDPGTGDIDWSRFFRILADRDYRGKVSLEYVPSDARAGLGWTYGGEYGAAGIGIADNR